MSAERNPRERVVEGRRTGRGGEASLPREDAATLSAIADFVVNLSIAERNHRIYGGDHPMGRRATDKVRGALDAALELRDPVTLRFTPTAVFCGSHCLERGHPIYRRFAQRMWRFGIAGLGFRTGIAPDELARLLQIVSRAEGERTGREDLEKSLLAAEMSHVALEFLHQLVTFTPRDAVEPLSAREQEALWEEFVRRLHGVAGGRTGSTLPSPGADGATALSPAMTDDYATAVIEYMKHLERSERQDALLEGTEIGRRIRDFLGRANPELRQQIMASAVTRPEVTPELLNRLVNLVGCGDLVEALQRLSDGGSGLPESAVRNLSLLALLHRDPAGSLPEGGPTPMGQEGPDDVRRLLDQLLADDRGATYMRSDYQQTLASIGQQAERLAVLQRAAPSALRIARRDGERHFLAAAADLLGQFQVDRPLAASVCREAQRSFRIFLDHGGPTDCRRAMELARRGREAAGGTPDPYVWERGEVLDVLGDRLRQGGPWQVEAAEDLLRTIGTPAVPKLLEVLAASHNLSARKRALAILEAVEQPLAPVLLPLADRRRPWYLQRNAVYLLRRRREAAGLDAAVALWAEARAPVKAEVLRYLFELEDPRGAGLLAEALEDGDPDVAVAAAGEALRTERAELAEAVLARIARFPRHQVGTDLHWRLVERLARCPDLGLRERLKEVMLAQPPLLPWQRERFRRSVAELLGEAP